MSAKRKKERIPWQRNQEVIALTERYVMNTYKRQPIALVRGEGCKVWDADGTQYLDFVAGLAVCNLGHCPTRVVAAIQEQASRLLHVHRISTTSLGRPSWRGS